MPNDVPLHEAVANLAQIRQQLTRTTTFRGYRISTVGMSGLIGIVVAILQSQVIERPDAESRLYVLLWSGTAALCLFATGVDIFFDIWFSKSNLRSALAKQAILLFLPSIVLGGAITAILTSLHSELIWLLPAMWSTLFSLGCFSSAPVLPRVGAIMGFWYGTGGIVALFLAERALSPWCMGIIFGLGQLLSMTVLYFCVEREHGSIQ